MAIEWNEVLGRLRLLAAVDQQLSEETQALWRSDQDASLRWIADRLQECRGVLVADEVGLGKTRLAIALAVCVASCGGRVAFLVPPGLIAQWREDELGSFLKQFNALPPECRPSGLEQSLSPACVELKTYRDLFLSEDGNPIFPVSRRAPFVFVSHRFGVPLRLGKNSDDERWGLPFALKGQMFDGRSVKGAKKLALSSGQEAAIDWLHDHLPPIFRQALEHADLGRVNGTSLKTQENERLFQHLIGELIGDVDLIVIDEAHKNRLGSEAVDTESGKKNRKMQEALSSRMSACLNHILLRPGASTLRAKRLVLTATPMEMDAAQWSGILQRIGLESGEIEGLTNIAVRFSEAVTGLTIGSPAQVNAVKEAAAAFQQAFRPLVTRRLWRDHPDVQRYSRSQGQGVKEQAHPHRRFLPARTVRLGDLDQRERDFLAQTECLAVASRGIETEQAMKTAGARSSQGLPLWSEAAIVPDNEGDQHTVQENADGAAQKKRQAYWLQRLRHLQYGAGVGAEEKRGDINLQWHPRIKAAVALIEEISERKEKVLVFGAFLEPMRALNRALNIRHYLRHVRDGKPIALPTGLHAGDADIRRWMADGDFKFSEAQIADFVTSSQKLSEQYHQGRAYLRQLCRSEVDNFLQVPELDDDSQASEAASDDDAQQLTNWLVQCMIVGTETDSGLVANNVIVQELRQRARTMLSAICDAEPTEFDSESGELADMLMGRRKAVRRHLVEEAEQAGGRIDVFRMSPFSQMLYGDTKPGTRRVRQRAFNDTKIHPNVLIGQAAVASEGLNLHRACRHVVLFHLDWNPGRIEQQIGRVDRQDSHWMRAFEQWLQEEQGAAPTIDIHTISIEGSYDALRTEIVQERAKVLRSQLFGEILPPDVLSQLPAEARDAISQIRIDFTPGSSAL